MAKEESRETSRETYTAEDYSKLLGKHKNDGDIYKQIFGIRPEKGHEVDVIMFDAYGELCGFMILREGNKLLKIV